MENQLIKVSMPLPEIIKMAEIFAASGMFVDAKAMGQAFVKIQAGQEIGIPPFQSMSGVHVIQGKTTLGAGIIASRVKGSGKYDYRVIELNEQNCSLDFFQGSQKIGNSSFNLDDAKKAGTKNIDKFPKNMLFARAISNGVKWFCPDVFSGPVYTPEEMETTIDINHEVVDNTPATCQIKQPIVLSEKKFKSALEKLASDPIKILTALKGCNMSPEQKSMMNDCIFDFLKNLDINQTENIKLQETIIGVYELPKEMIDFLTDTIVIPNINPAF